MKKILFGMTLVLTSFWLGAGTASAHVRLDPSQAVVGRQSYGIRVPNEKDIPTVKVSVQVPEGVQITGVMPTAGWTHTETKASAEAGQATDGHGGSQERITEVTWSGGQIAPGEYMVFNINTNYTGTPGELVWKAYQTYADGTTVAWDDTNREEGPAPRVVVADQSEMDALKAQVEALEAEGTGFKPDINTYLAGAALLMSLAVLLFVWRSNQGSRP